MKSLTVCYITCRKNHQFYEWFMPSLLNQLGASDKIEVILIDTHQADFREEKHYIAASGGTAHLLRTQPKPSVWQGKHRLTKEDWWAIANAKNTGICLCRTEWFATVDDRSVLVPTWLSAVNEAMEKNYVVAGAYEKVHHLQVENGLVTGYDQPGDGKDFRYPKSGRLYPQMIGGNSFYGCTGALPLEWCLEVNGYPEEADSLGLEDCLFGSILDNCGKPFFYDPRMLILEDRTPSELEPPPLRTDKGVSPNDRSHMLKHKIEVLKRCNPEFDLRAIRDKVLAGGEFPLPTGPTHDYWDNTPLAEMKVQ